MKYSTLQRNWEFEPQNIRSWRLFLKILHVDNFLPTDVGGRHAQHRMRCLDVVHSIPNCPWICTLCGRNGNLSSHHTSANHYTVDRRGGLPLFFPRQQTTKDLAERSQRPAEATRSSSVEPTATSEPERRLGFGGRSTTHVAGC